MPDPTTETPAENPPAGNPPGALFRVLVTGNRDPEAVYTAVREVESMAAVTTVAQLCAKIETVAERLDTVNREMNARFDSVNREMNARFDSANREMNARFDSVNRQLRLIWAFLFVVMAAMTTILLRI